MNDVFVDTSAFLAILNANDQFHTSASQAWVDILDNALAIHSSNYVILETTSILQHRHGVQSVRLFESEVLAVVNVIWIDEHFHRRGMSTLLAANRRGLSLVDCTSFEIMRQMGIKLSFTFDPHFQEQGFEIIPT